MPSGHLTRCAYKGAASYWHVRVGGELVEDLVWSYPDPEHDALPVRDMYCFFSEKVDIELDGVVEERPSTQWSPCGCHRRRRAARADGPAGRVARHERQLRLGGVVREPPALRSRASPRARDTGANRRADESRPDSVPSEHANWMQPCAAGSLTSPPSRR